MVVVMIGCGSVIFIGSVLIGFAMLAGGKVGMGLIVLLPAFIAFVGWCSRCLSWVKEVSEGDTPSGGPSSRHRKL
jgi:hypothetical protein